MAEHTDVVRLIEADHRTVERMFTRLEADDTPGAEKQTLLEQVAHELIAHSKGEEDVVYPDIKAAAPREDDDVKDGVAEHHHIEELLEQIVGKPLDAPGADGILAAVVAEVRHHVEEEEQDILPRYRKATDDAHRAEVGRRFQQRKDEEFAANGWTKAEPDDLIDLTQLTKDELYERAKQQGIEGRSDMTKDELINALRG